jgi:hypothetical protein
VALPALVLVLSAPITALAAEVGDRIVIRPGHKHPIVIQRDLPENAALLIASLDAADFQLLTPHALPEARAVLQAVAGDPPAWPAPPRPWRRLLHRLK